MGREVGLVDKVLAMQAQGLEFGTSTSVWSRQPVSVIPGLGRKRQEDSWGLLADLARQTAEFQCPRDTLSQNLRMLRGWRDAQRLGTLALPAPSLVAHNCR